jgi:hypothetical protein
MRETGSLTHPLGRSCHPGGRGFESPRFRFLLLRRFPRLRGGREGACLSVSDSLTSAYVLAEMLQIVEVKVNLLETLRPPELNS